MLIQGANERWEAGGQGDDAGRRVMQERGGEVGARHGRGMGEAWARHGRGMRGWQERRRGRQGCTYHYSNTKTFIKATIYSDRMTCILKC